MLKDRIEDSLTFDDVLLVPQASRILPSDVMTTTCVTQSISLNIPLLSIKKTQGSVGNFQDLTGLESVNDSTSFKFLL